MRRVDWHWTSTASGRLWRIGVLTAAGAIGTATYAEAALYYYPDSDPGFYRPGPMIPQRRQKVRRQSAKKTGAPEKESAKPQGPLVIAISIQKQKLRIYDANGLFAETPVSTGMSGHATPMGVFSVIQKQKLHHSNIYSGAPMPYMQRITWSGIAVHAGVLPGYPASHGCIRMPMAFAVKMWGWTKMGARVVVTPGEISPASFSHPLLVAQKVVPEPATADEPKTDAPPAAKSDKASDAGPAIKPVTSEVALDLRSTVGHHTGVRPIMSEPSAAAPLREQTHTADAGVLPTTNAATTMSDAAPSDGSAPLQEEGAAAATDSAPPMSADAAPVKAGDAPNAEAKSEAEVKSGAAQASDDVAKGEAPASEGVKAATAEVKAPEAKGQDLKAEVKVEATKVEAKTDDVKTEAAKADAPKADEKPGASVRAVTDIGASVPDVKKDEGRLPGADKPVAAKPAPKREGQIAAFVSRKDSKLYVRQNFAPLFDAPVKIAPSDRPLGTHVFTAQVDKNDTNLLHWSVISLPASTRNADRGDDDERASRRRKMAGAGEIKPMPVPDSPAEALDRISIPADAMARIVEALSTGGSIIVSDQGINAGETGEGTDFIVSLR
jgi:lipoprotein-anchoring transpeptidase ErfK/SrfK